ncbi:L,D-transpeptidase [Rhizobium leguminosarum]|uniref:L,D-transpeptidase n=1 Tax=Rhizobium leguminosarum TaxID=384 RepID=UPI0015DA6BD1|nr:L,D-transpeptidase [Rhizobium leguminosarum]NZD53599.1 L,D-transpeptidase [Rhizobium leguminosarum]
MKQGRVRLACELLRSRTASRICAKNSLASFDFIRIGFSLAIKLGGQEMASRSNEKANQFSLDLFVQTHLEKKTEIELEAEVRSDGEHLIIFPVRGAPGTAFRVLNSDVRLPDAESSSSGPMRIGLKRNAPCVRLTAGVVDDFVPQDSEVDVAVKRAKIRLEATGKGTLSYAGKSVPCLGKANFPYAKDLTVQGSIDVDKFKEKYSNEWSAWMYWAVLIMGDRGVYIHEGAVEGTSAGCIHLAAPTAKEFYDWVDGPTRIEISYAWQ